MDEFIFIITIFAVFGPVFGVIVYMNISSSFEYRKYTIGDKTALVLWCGPLVWLGALVWLLHKWIVDTVNKQFGGQE